MAQVSEKYQRELVGDAARDVRRFPLLLKFLFPHEKLSVQVQAPMTNRLAASASPWGKTECWYVAHAKPGSANRIRTETGRRARLRNWETRSMRSAPRGS